MQIVYECNGCKANVLTIAAALNEEESCTPRLTLEFPVVVVVSRLASRIRIRIRILKPSGLKSVHGDLTVALYSTHKYT